MVSEKDGTPFDPASIAHELEQRARTGDVEAIREIWFAGMAFAQVLAGLAYRDDPPTQVALKSIAADEVLWPAVVSRHGRIRGNKIGIQKYLDEIGLGSAKNLNFDNVDPRSHHLLAGVMFFGSSRI
jgi:hypothetical protein